MPTIGGVSCDILRGTPEPLGEVVEVWRLDGVDGYGARKLGQGDAPFVFRALKFDTLANINAWIASLKALQATVVSATDDHGTTTSGLLVTRATAFTRKEVIYQGNERVRATAVIEGVKTT